MPKHSKHRRLSSQLGRRYEWLLEVVRTHEGEATFPRALQIGDGMLGTAFKINRCPSANVTENPLREEIPGDATTGPNAGKIIFCCWPGGDYRLIGGSLGDGHRRNASSFQGRSQIPERDHKVATCYPLQGEGAGTGSGSQHSAQRPAQMHVTCSCGSWAVVPPSLE
jgi:hypothetical protein